MWLLYGAGDCTAVPIEHGKQNSCRLIFGTQLKLVRPFTFCITLIFTNVAKIRAISLGFPEKKNASPSYFRRSSREPSWFTTPITLGLMVDISRYIVLVDGFIKFIKTNHNWGHHIVVGFLIEKMRMSHCHVSLPEGTVNVLLEKSRFLVIHISHNMS